MNHIDFKTNLLWFCAGFLIFALFLTPLFSSDLQEYVTELLRAHPYAAPLIVIGVRFVSIVVAPLPGIPVSFASIAFLPWYEAFIYNLIAVELGSVCAFFIARYFREPVVARFTPLQRIEEWQKTISRVKQFWGFVGLRFMSVAAFDFVSYAAGLTALPFKTFFIASLLVDVPVSFIFFYGGSVAFKYSMYIFFGFAALFMGTVAVSQYYMRRASGE